MVHFVLTEKVSGLILRGKKMDRERMVLYEHLCLAVLTGDGDVDIVVRKYWEQVRIPGDYSFSTYSKSSTKLTLPLIPMCAYQRVRNNSFSETFVYKTK